MAAGQALQQPSLRARADYGQGAAFTLLTAASHRTAPVQLVRCSTASNIKSRLK